MKRAILINLIIFTLSLVCMNLADTAEGYVPLVPLPGASAEPSFSEYVAVAIRIGIILAALLAVVMIIIAGFIYITAGGNPGKLDQAKKFIWDALIGLVIALGYWIILQAINPNILNNALGLNTGHWIYSPDP